MTKSIAVHGCCLTGLSLLIYSAWLMWPPLALASTGCLLVAFGLFLHKSTQPKGSQ